MVKKGYIYTLEVLMAVSIIFLTMVFVFKMPKLTPDTSSLLLKQKTEDSLKVLDSDGILRKLVSENNEESLRGNLTSLFQPGIGFESRICRSYCEAPLLPDGKTVTHVVYYLTGHEEYDYASVHVWLWVNI